MPGRPGYERIQGAGCEFLPYTIFLGADQNSKTILLVEIVLGDHVGPVALEGIRRSNQIFKN
jgi:hypothetical protein